MSNIEKRAEENREIEKAITYMVTAIQESGNNPKPVILHSTRVFALLDESRGKV